MPAYKNSVIADKGIVERLKITIRLTGLSNSEFCRITGLKLSTLSTWLYGHCITFSYNSAKSFAEMASKCGVQITTTWLLTGDGTPPRIESVVYSERLKKTTFAEEQHCQTEIASFAKNPNNIVLLMPDDAMEPVFTKSDYVGGQLFHGKELALITGRNCIVKTAHHGILCRRFILNKNKEFELRFINLFSETDTPVLTNIEIVGAAPVTRFWRRLDLYPTVPEHKD